MAVARSYQSASRLSLRDGLNRAGLAAQIANDVLATIGVKREELADKKIHTVGERRLMKYHADAKK